MTTPALPQPACLVTQLCLALCNLMDCNLPGSSVSGILQARILQWVATSFSGGSSWPRDWTPVSYNAGRFFTVWATRKAQPLPDLVIINSAVMDMLGLTLLWSIYVSVEELDHRVHICSVLIDNAKLFSQVPIPTNTLTGSIWEFQLLHILDIVRLFFN